MSEFKNLDKFKIPLQNLKPSLSTVVYKRIDDVGWSPTNFKKGLPHGEKYDYVFHDINWKDKVLIVITGKKQEIEWGVSKDVFEIEWELIIVFWDAKNNLLFIHGSKKFGHYENLARAVFGEDCIKIDSKDIYRVFHNVKRVKLQNVGLKEYLGKNIRFRMSAGTDIEDALSLVEKQRAQKAFAFGVGYETGNKVSLGCSSKGRIWTRMTGNVKQFTEWSKKLGEKLANLSIDPNTILRDTLIAQLKVSRPNIYPISIDWSEEVYLYPESKYNFLIGDKLFDLSNCQLEITSAGLDNELNFSLVTSEDKIDFQKKLFEDKDGFPDFKIIKTSKQECIVEFGRKSLPVEEFLNKYIPTIWFADGSSLTGNEYFELKQIMPPYSKTAIINDWDWQGVDLSSESQGFVEKKTSSIQYKVIQRLRKDSYDIIYNDDDSGEMADIVTMKLDEEKLSIGLYHLKYALGGKISGQIKNLYEVCGQAQKSIRWKHRKRKEVFDHFLKREEKKKKKFNASRLEKGTIQDLERFQELTKNKIPVKFEIYIVQPGISQETISDEMLTLLSVTENYLKEKAGINLKIVGNGNKV